MKALWRKIKCLLGFHEWTVVYTLQHVPTGYGFYKTKLMPVRECIHCRRRKKYESKA